MTLTPQLLADCIDCPLARAQQWAAPLDDAMRLYMIVKPERIAAYLANIGHESGRLAYVRELWGPTPAQLTYEGRVDLGNTQPGDGFRYRGRGLIQITGRANYRAAGRELGVDFEALPAWLEKPHYAALSAAWFWASHGLNELADIDDMRTITRRINGGMNGHAERVALWQRARKALEIAS